MALLPCSQAAHAVTASNSLLPGHRRLVLRHHLLERLDAGIRDELRLHRLVVEEDAAVGAVLLEEGELVAGAARLPEMHGAIDLGRQLVGDELGHLGIFVPGPRHLEVLIELRLVGGLELLVAEDVLAVVEREDIAVVEDAPALALVGRHRLVERMVVLQVRLVHVLVDIVVDRRDHAAIGERGNPGRLDLEDVVGAGLRDVLGDRLRVLVGMRELDDAEVGARELLPERAREVARLERLETGLVGHVEGDAGKLLGGLDGPIGRAVRRPFGRCLDGGGLRLAERRIGRRQIHALHRVGGCHPEPGHAQGRAAEGGPTAEHRQALEERSPRAVAS